MLPDSVVFTDNLSFDLAERFVRTTSRSIFLTGKAGTGKTTFLKKICEDIAKNTVVVAPTGVAAINAGGTTIHSFFQLPFSPFIPRNISPGGAHALLQNLRIESEKRNMFRELELLIIDEVSMVRCDVLDAVDVILRHFRRKENLPFGGVQLLLIGDLFQLPPVVQPQEWSILSEFYQSPFFFDAHVIKEVQPLCVELKKIYRQRDHVFVEMLNRVRNSEVTADDMELLNRRYDPSFAPARDDRYITLTTHNQRADRINATELDALTEELHVFEATVEGDFPDRMFPTEKSLFLKAGAQVMFLKNDTERVRRYYNGKIATVVRIGAGTLTVSFPGEEGELEVEKDTWQNIRYAFNPVSRSIEEEVVGTFTQFPLRLAWAITIHKSQGLTFEKAIIDAGSSFAAGQVYVALSRCTTLDGIVLKSRIFRNAIKTDERVLAFAEAEMQDEELGSMLSHEQQQFLVEKLLRIFDFSIMIDEVGDFLEDIGKTKEVDREQATLLLRSVYERYVEYQEVARRFSLQLHQLLMQREGDAIQKRIGQAVTYFAMGIDENVLAPLEEHRANTKKLKKVKKYLKKLGELIALLRDGRELLEKGSTMVERISSPMDGKG